MLLALLIVFKSPVFSQQLRTGIGTRNPQGPLHIDGQKDNPPQGLASADQASNDVIITEQGRVGVGLLNPLTALDLRALSGNNAIGLGTSSLPAGVAGAGALHFQTSNNALEFSDGQRWKPVAEKPQRVVVEASITDARAIPHGSFVRLDRWQLIHNVGEAFNPQSGEFKAPRAGYYSFFFNFSFVPGSIVQRSSAQVRLRSNLSTYHSVMKTYSQPRQKLQVGGDFMCSIRLLKHEIVFFEIAQNVAWIVSPPALPHLAPSLRSSSRNLRAHSDPSHPDAGFNQLSIIEH